MSNTKYRVGTVGWFIVACLLSGCHLAPPKVKIEPVVFNHPEEVLKGTGAAEQCWAMADRRVFAVMAFINAAGYDEEAPGHQMHPLRLKVRQKIAENLAAHPEQLRAWQAYYKQHPLGSWKYANFALSLSADYPFRPIRPASEMHDPWIARSLADFPDVLNQFWAAAKLDQVWAELRPDYLAEIKRYSPQRMAEERAFLWSYLRMPRKDNYVVIQVPNPLQRSASASGNRFENYFYSIDGPASSGGGLNVHEYLHTVVNDLVKLHYPAQAPKLRAYYETGKDATISRSYGEPVNWCIECLVHALDHRITVQRLSDPAARKRVEAEVETLTRGGYTLLEPLYQALADFEQSGQPFDQYLPILLQRLPDFSPSAAGPNH